MRVFISFVLMYLVVNYLFSVGLSIVRGDTFRLALLFFLTAPVNLYENFSGAYSSPVQGLLSNFVVTALMLGLCEGYCRQAQVRLKAVLTVDCAFVVSIVASYALSAVVWAIEGWPAYGSSIIGFCMTTFLLVNTILDYRIYSAKVKGREFLVKQSLWLAGLVLSALLIPIGYAYGNAGFPLHVGGLLIFSTIAFIIRHRSDSLRPSSWQ